MIYSTCRTKTKRRKQEKEFEEGRGRVSSYSTEPYDLMRSDKTTSQKTYIRPGNYKEKSRVKFRDVSIPIGRNSNDKKGVSDVLALQWGKAKEKIGINQKVIRRHM